MRGARSALLAIVLVQQEMKSHRLDGVGDGGDATRDRRRRGFEIAPTGLLWMRSQSSAGRAPWSKESTLRIAGSGTPALKAGQEPVGATWT